MQRFGQLGDRCHPDFIEIKVVDSEPSQRLLGNIVGGVFKAAGKQYLFKHRSVRIGNDRFILRPQCLVHFSDELLTA